MRSARHVRSGSTRPWLREPPIRLPGRSPAPSRRRRKCVGQHAGIRDGSAGSARRNKFEEAVLDRNLLARTRLESKPTVRPLEDLGLDRDLGTPERRIGQRPCGHAGGHRGSPWATISVATRVHSAIVHSP